MVSVLSHIVPHFLPPTGSGLLLHVLILDVSSLLPFP